MEGRAGFLNKLNGLVDLAKAKGYQITIEEVRKNIIERDMLQKKAGYYDLHEISQVIDVTDCKSVKESTDKVLEALDLSILI